MPTKEWDPETIFDLIGDRIARQILILASEESLAADELAEQLDSSLPSVYRRVNELAQYDLINEEIQIADDGNHYKTYHTTLDELLLEISDGTITATSRLTHSDQDQFEAFWSDLGEVIDAPAQESNTTEVHSSTDPDGSHG